MMYLISIKVYLFSKRSSLKAKIPFIKVISMVEPASGMCCSTKEYWQAVPKQYQAVSKKGNCRYYAWVHRGQASKKMDYERKQDKVRKQTTAFKRRKRHLSEIRSSKDVFLELRERTAYDSGCTLY